jgi:hypothetical protein
MENPKEIREIQRNSTSIPSALVPFNNFNANS